MAEHGVDLVVVGPEAPLVAGVADALAGAGVACFGPGAGASRLEGSKAFCKEIMDAAGVPTAAYHVVTDVEAGMAAVPAYPVVIKADGLAAGKGVIIAADEAEAREALTALLVEHRFGTDQVVVEEFLDGEELSLLAAMRRRDRAAARLRPGLQAHRRRRHRSQHRRHGLLLTGARGRRRAGARALRAVHQPVLDELARRGTPFHGVLYAGLMMTSAGPRVLEFNVRFGDPETQAILPRLDSDLLALLTAACTPGGPARCRPWPGGPRRR